MNMDNEILTIRWDSGEINLIMKNFLFFPCSLSKLKKLEKIILEDNNYREIFQRIERFIHDQIHVCVVTAQKAYEEFDRLDQEYKERSGQTRRANYKNRDAFWEARETLAALKSHRDSTRIFYKKYERAVREYEELYSYILDKWEWALK